MSSLAAARADNFYFATRQTGIRARNRARSMQRRVLHRFQRLLLLFLF